MSDSNLMLDAEEEIMNLEDDYPDDGRASLKADDSDDKLNSSSNSLDKYVGKGRNSKYMTLLPEDFEPGDMDVLCGRGKKFFNSPGNQRFRKLVAARAEDYAAATTRTDKTFIVCSIVSEVRKASPKGGFVKKDSATGRWYEVGDFNAHEKTSQMFRDVLHESYLSSNKSKKKRRDLFRTNSKRRAMLQQQAQAQTINASSGRFLRANGVARHHSYGSIRMNGQQISLLKMRQQARMGSEHSNSVRAADWQNNSHSSWQNSWQSDGIRSEPGLPGNPRAFFAQRGRENSLGDLSGSIGELRVPETQPFHNSIGDLRFNSSFGDYQAQEDFHNSCGEFHNSFGEFNSNGLGLASSGNNPMMNNNQNSYGEINPLGFNDSFGGPADFHNSFGEYVNNDNRARAMAMARARANATPTASMMMNTSELRPPDVYRRSNSDNFGQLNSGFNPGLPQMEPDYDVLDLQPPSVPLSISVPSEQSTSNNNAIEREQFQLEFENSDIVRREREAAMRQQQQQQRQQQRQRRGVSIVDALDTAGYSGRNQTDEDPFEPVPVSDLNEMQMETIF